MNFKQLVSISIFLILLQTYSSSFAAMRDISEIYYGITNPCESLIIGSTLESALPAVKIPGENFFAYSLMATLNTLPLKMENKSLEHTNSFLKLLTFFNEDSLRNLNSVYIAGIYLVPYSCIMYDVKNEWYYGAKHLDAMSVMLYGYAYLINIPKKILDEFDALLVRINKANGTIYEATVLHKLIYTLDIFMHILSLLIEIPLALFNTFIGFFIGLLFHPWDSICSFLGFFYFAICSTGTAIFGLIADIFIVPYHLIF